MLLYISFCNVLTTNSLVSIHHHTYAALYPFCPPLTSFHSGNHVFVYLPHIGEIIQYLSFSVWHFTQPDALKAPSLLNSLNEDMAPARPKHVHEPGQLLLLLSGQGCARSDLNVHRTGFSISSHWARFLDISHHKTCLPNKETLHWLFLGWENCLYKQRFLYSVILIWSFFLCHIDFSAL